MVKKVTFGELHHHMGHIAPNTAKNLIQKGLVTGLELKDSPTPFTHCSSCIYVKAQCKSVPIVCKWVCATEYGAEVHTDVWGPSKIATLAGRHYYVLFTDDYTHETHLFLLRQKSEVFTVY